MNEKEKDIQATLKSLEKEFGKGSVFAAEQNSRFDEKFVPTGSLLIDKAIGAGYPLGRITEIYGPEAAGKTTLALHAIAEAQKAGLRCAFIDAEHALDIKYAASLGVNLKELLIAQPDSGEQALSIIEALSRTGQIGLVVVDSVAALVPQIELEGDISDQTIGAHARLMSKALRVLVGQIKRSEMAVIFINQLREKVGVMFGNPEITTGGRSLRFYASLRLEVRKETLIKEGDANIGVRSRVTVTKNKMSPPFSVAHVNIFFGRGFDYQNELVEYATEKGIIAKSGSWYSFGELRLGQGAKQAKEFLLANPQTYEEVRALVQSNTSLAPIEP